MENGGGFGKSATEGIMKVLKQEPLKNHTTWKIGGNAEFLIIPKSKEDIFKAIKFAQRSNLDITVIGNGSNILVKDGGLDGVVIKLGSGFSNVEIENVTVRAEAGISLPKLVRKLCDNNLKGMEFAIGIPASLGGAVVMNAGAHGFQLGDFVKSVEVINQQGKVQHIRRDKLKFSYRKSSIMDMFITDIELELEKGDNKLLMEEMEKKLKVRKKNQPLNFPNAGSVFKNPPGDYAGRLIEAAGLKGAFVGGAEVSELHANFIVNTGDATAKDILKLIDMVIKIVKEKFGIGLELEIKVLGKD